jgi:hypothetical protein
MEKRHWNTTTMITEGSFAANGFLTLFTVSCGAAWFSYFRTRGSTLAETMAYALVATIMVQAWVAQVLLIIGGTSLYLPILFLCMGLSIKICFTYHRKLTIPAGAFIQFIRSHQVAAGGLLLVWGYTAVVCIWPLDPFDRKMLLYYQPIWDDVHSVFKIWATAPDMVLPVLNHAIFGASWQPALAIALTNLSAYAAIGFATYALARRYAWPPMAITVTLLVISMQRVIYQSMTAPSELLPAASALLAILALFRMCEQPHGRDLIMLVITISYSVSGGRLCYLMPAVLCALSFVALGRRYGPALWHQLASGPRIWVSLATAMVVVVFSQAGVVCTNLVRDKSWIGESIHYQVAFNSDAHFGLLGNMARYMFLTFELPTVVDRFLAWAFGFSLLEGLKRLYVWAVAGPLGLRGAATAFDWTWTPMRELSWFGPVGFFLVIPSVVVALLRGPRRLKTTALAMVVYWILIALIIAWQPGNVRLMTRFFICSGFFMAFLLPPWRLGGSGQMVLQVLSILLLVHALLA